MSDPIELDDEHGAPLICGASASASITDIGIGVWLTCAAGVSASAYIEDVALLIYGAPACGGVATSSFEEEAAYTLTEFYGATVIGSSSKARMFIDPYVPGLSRFLPEGQSS